ncbi:unnamed protein product [Closterium sp. NIES-65]|nr:unnamed protein product [Closterium sp. NIES-65]
MTDVTGNVSWCVPDVDLMFECNDWPLVERAVHAAAAHPPPLLLKYCSTARHMDVVWPDWSFWGWGHLVNCSRQGGGEGGEDSEEGAGGGGGKEGGMVGEDAKGQGSEGKEAERDWGVDAWDTKWVHEIAEETTRLENQCTHRWVDGSTGGLMAAQVG